MKALFFTFCLSIVISSIDAKQQENQLTIQEHTPINEQQAPSQQNIVYVPIPINQKPAPTDDEQRDKDLFGTFFSIAGHFGKILLDPHNTPSVLQSAGNMINGIVNAVQIITRAQKDTDLPPDVVKALLIKTIVKEAQQYNSELKKAQIL